MLPTHLVRPPAPKHHHPGGVAVGGPDRRALLITGSLPGDIGIAGVPMAGKTLLAHRQARNGT